MKNFVFKTVLALIIFTFCGAGCEKEDTNNVDSKLTLTNTKWKLIGFSNASDNIIDLARPECDECYIITFYDDNTLSGVTSTNVVTGDYEVDYTSYLLTITRLGGTEINELLDGPKYVKAITDVKSFNISEKGLKLYYGNSNTYLIFKTFEK